jgi:hypothetical protein
MLREMSATPPASRLAPSPVAVAIGVLCCLGVLIAAAGPGRPTASPTADLVLRVAAVVVVGLAAARAQPWTLLGLVGVAAATTTGTAAVVAWVALVGTVAALARPIPEPIRPVFGAAVGVLGFGCLQRQVDYGSMGTSLLVGLVVVAPILVSAYRASGPRARRTTAVVAGIVAGLTVVAGLVLVATGLLVRPSLTEGADDADAAISAARAAREDEALMHLQDAEAAFDRADDLLGRPWVAPLRYVPVMSQHLAALQQVAREGTALASSPDVVQAVSDYRGLKYESGRVDVERARSLEAPVVATAELLAAAEDRVGAVDRTWLVPAISDRLVEFEDRLAGAADDAAVAADVLALVPALLGADGDRHYVVAFTTPAEARGIGGFFGNYGELEAVDGEVRMVRSGSVLDIEPTVPGVRTLRGPDEYLARYGRYRPADYLRDATFSPHFPYVADVISQLYPQAGGPPVDGVVLMDPYALAALLEFTGPIEVPGYPEPLTSENLPDIVIRQQYIDFAEDNDARKDILVDATEIAFDRLLEGDLPAPGELIDALGPMVRQRRLLLWSVEAAEQELFEAIGADGAVPAADDHDLLLVTHQNYGNNKVDAYFQRSVDYDATVDEATGEVEATATITLTNRAPADGLPDYVIGNQRSEPLGSNVMNLTALSSSALRSATLDGVPVELDHSTEVGLNAYDLRLTIPPRSSRRLVLELKGGVDLRTGPYRLRLVPQAMTNPDEVQVTVDGEPAVRCGDAGPRRTPPATLTEVVDVGAPGCRSSEAAPQRSGRADE